LVLLGVLFCWPAGTAFGQAPSGTVRGTVTLAQNGDPLHKAVVVIVQLGRTMETDDNGEYQFDQVPAGTYDVAASSPALTADRQIVQVTAGGVAMADFRMRVASLREQITVTAAGREELPTESFQSTSTLDSVQLVEDNKASLGEVLEGQPGVAKRSFGPGNSRPVIRGFDGDRIAIMKDGMPTGTLSSQSGDHGETLNTLNLDRLEVVKGPETLLYGSNAIGGVVNAITPRNETHEHPHPGISGYLTGMGGSANNLGGGAAGLQFGAGNWLLWGDVGGQRTSDYNTPIGEIFNSSTHSVNGGGGFGRYAAKNFFSFSFVTEDSVYFIPPVEDEVVHLALRRYNPRFTGGFQNLDSPIEGFRLTLDYSDYHHEELDDLNVPGTIFDNNVFSYRGMFDQRRTGRLTGSFGFSGLHRDYTTVGEEALAPPLDQNNFAFFTLQTVSLERFRLQFGARVDHTAYTLAEPQAGLVDRSFTGFSGAAGINVPLWMGGAFVANYTHSYRAPALEELYNNGPHPGNQTFEVGNTDLTRERSDGIDLSLKQQSGRVRAEANFFYYHIDDFVFLAPTGNITDELIEAEYLQAGSRFLGGEANVDVSVNDYFGLNAGLDIVRAELTSSVTSPSTGVVTPSGTPLPRIPPLRGRVGFDFHYRGFSLRPEAVFSDAQDELFVTESRTAGSSVFNLNASYTIARQHAVQVFSVSAFNLGDRLYRNHLSFIKDIAPEIGRGVRVAYTVRFF
jgi:iron complex outermembrane receptor protein